MSTDKYNLAGWTLETKEPLRVRVIVELPGPSLVPLFDFEREVKPGETVSWEYPTGGLRITAD